MFISSLLKNKAALRRSEFPKVQFLKKLGEFMFKGVTDLAGIGKLVGELRGFVMDLLRHWAERENRELKNEELRLKNRDREIKNKAASVQLVQNLFVASEKCDCSPEELLELIYSSEFVADANRQNRFGHSSR